MSQRQGSPWTAGLFSDNSPLKPPFPPWPHQDGFHIKFGKGPWSCQPKKIKEPTASLGVGVWVSHLYLYITSKMKSSFLGGTPSSSCRKENDTFWRNLKNISPKKLQSFVNLVVNLSPSTSFSIKSQDMWDLLFQIPIRQVSPPPKNHKLYNETPRSPNCWQCFGRFAWNFGIPTLTFPGDKTSILGWWSWYWPQKNLTAGTNEQIIPNILIKEHHRNQTDPWFLGLNLLVLRRCVFTWMDPLPRTCGSEDFSPWSMVMVGTSSKDQVAGTPFLGMLTWLKYVQVIRSPLQLTGSPSSKYTEDEWLIFRIIQTDHNDRDIQKTASSAMKHSHLHQRSPDAKAHSLTGSANFHFTGAGSPAHFHSQEWKELYIRLQTLPVEEIHWLQLQFG